MRYVVVIDDQEQDRGTREELTAKYSAALVDGMAALITSGVWDLVAACDVIANGPRFPGESVAEADLIVAGLDRQGEDR